MKMKDRKNKFDWQPGDIEILYHPDPEIEKQLKEQQQKAKEEREKQENQE